MIKRKLLSLLLTTVLILTAAPVTAFAENAEDQVNTVNSDEQLTVADFDDPTDEISFDAEELQENTEIEETETTEETEVIEIPEEIIVEEEAADPSVSEESLPAEDQTTEEEEELEIEETQTQDPSDVDVNYNTGTIFQYSIHPDGISIDRIIPDETTLALAIPGKIDGYTVTRIGNDAMRNSGSNVTYVSIPASVTSIGKYAFSRNFKLERVEFCPNSQLKTIEGYAFHNCTDLHSIELPDGLETINPCAFQFCSDLREIVLPDSVTYVGANAFTGCTNLKSIHFSAGLTTIENSLFLQNLIWIYVPKNVTSIGKGFLEYISFLCYEGTEGDLTYVNLNGGDISGKLIYYGRETPLFSIADDPVAGYTITEYIGTDEEVVIPSSINGVPVTSIHEKAFMNNYQVKRVVIEEGITDIGNYAFSGCANLESITLPSTLKTIGWDAFNACRSLQSIEIPYGVEELLQRTFCNCSSLTQVVVPGSVKSIESYCFGGSVDSLKSVTLEEGVETIWNNAFYRCKSLKTLNLPKSLKTIYDDAIIDCDALTTINYNGSLSDYNKITIKEPNDQLLNLGVNFADTKTPVITKDVENVICTLNSTVTFSVTVKNAASYQWFYSTDSKNWYKSSASSAKTNTFPVKVTSSNKNRMYRCVITGKNGNKINSSIGKVSIIPGVTITQQPFSQVVRIGDTASFKVTANNVAKDGYCWYYSKDGGSNWYKSSSSGYNTDTLTIKCSSTNKTYMYKCVMTGTDGNKRTTGKAGFIPVTTLPADSTAIVGKKATFKVVTSASVTYQWQYSKDGENWFNTSATGNTTAAISVTVSTTNRSNYYRCKITDARGLYGFTSAVSFVNEPKAPKIITYGYTGNYVETGEDTSVLYSNFYVYAENVASYQWQYSTSYGDSWTNCTGPNAKCPCMEIDDDTIDYWTVFRCKLTGTNGTVIYTDWISNGY